MSPEPRRRIRLVLASANPDKVREIAAILPADIFELLPRPPEAGEIDETGETLIENARLKAKAIVAATGMGAVADDTGLEVESLGGAPGVRSARFAGAGASYADNVTKLLKELARLPDRGSRRRAAFRTVALAAFPDGSEVAAVGVVEGRISEASMGSEGFGYDPVFVPDEGGGRTFAEMSPVEKNACSHRGRAFTALAELLESQFQSRVDG